MRKEEARETAHQICMDNVISQPLAEGQSHMQTTEDIHGHPSRRAEYMGSMAADTSEGEDACDVSLQHERFEVPDRNSVYSHEIGSESTLDLSYQGIYQGIVMAEVLKRPQFRC